MNFKTRITVTLTLITLLSTQVFGQVNFTREDEIIVLKTNGDTLKNPWAGGFNSVQFSEIDLNLDGIKDLFVFDRTGNRISTFINSGETNEVSYKHDPSFIQYFPQGMHDWVLLRDYNCDGKIDILTYSGGGMAAYRNTSISQLSFELDTSLVHSDYNPDSIVSPSNPTGGPQFINIYISSTDIPAIDDIDGDGDLDVLTFSILGSYVEYHKNLSMERYGTCDSLDFQLTNKCWGFFKENQSNNSVTLYDSCSVNINNPEKLSGGNKHSGSTLFTLDMDANNSKELVLGDISFSNFTMLTNSDSSPNLTESLVTAQDSLFPQNNNSTLATDIEIFPAGYYFDVNNDNVKDLIAAPNCYNGCKNSDNVWYYKNNNATNNPDFVYTNNAFVQDGMIEVGEGAHPVFFDYNSDGLMDIIVGSYGIYDPSVGALLYQSGLWLYENIGTTSNPSYQLIDTDYANISTMNLDIAGSRPTLGLSPTFGDLDGDNYLDMILGDYNGFIHYFTNTAGAGNPAVFSITNPEYLGVDVGANATPLLYDLNNDNLLDLIIGKKLGTFSYYRNVGTSSVPNFSLTTDSLGKITTRRFYDFNGNSNPVIIDSAGTTILYSGAQNGFIYKFGDIDGNLNGKFSTDSSYLDIWEGINSYITTAEVNNDGKLDMLVGNYSGGVAFYKGDTAAPVTIKENNIVAELSIYPNPTNGLIHIDLGINDLHNAKISVIDLLGKTIYNQRVTTKKITLNLNSYAKGIYLVKFSNNTGSKVYKVIKE
ncbi:MAG: T9SS type A sorting domain-containing protein [Flavobacteriales bacterium]|nr:T9SS type A sorting domain-containing protein [Flavobacteriales bacterium]